MPDRPRIVLAIGLPGCGKSTYLAQIGANAISSDAIRRQLADDEKDQTIHARVFETIRYLLRQRIELNRAVTYIDATNLTRRDRKPFIAMAREHGCRIEALWFNATARVCKERNRMRGRMVPEHAIELMAAKFVPPALEEGFDAIGCAK